MDGLKRIVFFIGLSLSALFVYGCTVRTYTVDKPRVETEITGNQGYVSGQPKPEDDKAKAKLSSTRKVTVVEVELKGKGAQEPAEAESQGQEPVEEPDEIFEEVPLEDYSEAKSAKAKGSKGLQKISMGDNENLYITGEGKLWYVSEGPDGKTTKMQVQIDETTGEMTVVDVGGGKSGGPQPISMGNGYNMYITEEGQSWYVGDGSKARVEVDDNTGEITVLEQYGGGDDK